MVRGAALVGDWMSFLEGLLLGKATKTAGAVGVLIFLPWLRVGADDSQILPLGEVFVKTTPNPALRRQRHSVQGGLCI